MIDDEAYIAAPVGSPTGVMPGLSDFAEYTTGTEMTAFRPDFIHMLPNNVRPSAS